jgi:hypothetical protein
VFEFRDDGVNALNISLDSLDTEFPRLVSVLLIFVGVGLDDDGVSDDIDFGIKDAIREVALLTGLRLRIDEDDIPVMIEVYLYYYTI